MCSDQSNLNSAVLLKLKMRFIEANHNGSGCFKLVKTPDITNAIDILCSEVNSKL